MKDWVPLIVGVIAAATALTGYLVNSAIGRRAERARYYADALTTVEKYRQVPFTYKRRHDGTKETRAELAKILGDVQVTLAFYRRWLELDSPTVGAAYNRLVDKVRHRNHEFRKDALSSPPINNDIDIEIGSPYNFDSRAEMQECLVLMRQELRLFKWPKRLNRSGTAP